MIYPFHLLDDLKTILHKRSRFYKWTFLYHAVCLSKIDWFTRNNMTDHISSIKVGLKSNQYTQLVEVPTRIQAILSKNNKSLEKDFLILSWIFSSFGRGRIHFQNHKVKYILKEVLVWFIVLSVILHQYYFLLLVNLDQF